MLVIHKKDIFSFDLSMHNYEIHLGFLQIKKKWNNFINFEMRSSAPNHNIR